MGTDRGQKRIAYFDIAKGIGILLVLIGHLQNDIIFSYSPYILSLCSWIFSFHMPLFFIISGMLISCKREEEKDLKEIVKRKFRSIMIPYFWFSLIYIMIVLYSLLITKVVPLKTLFIQLWYVLGMYGMNVLWFLPALFASEVLFLFITQRFKGKRSILTILILFAFAMAVNWARQYLPNKLPIYERIDEFTVTVIRPVFACVYILTGYYLYRGLEFIKDRTGRSFIIELILMPVLLAVDIYLNTLNRPVDFRSLVLNNYLLYYICSVCGSVFIILLSRALSRIRGFRNKEKAASPETEKYTAFPFIRFCGVNSLIFMAVHNNSEVMKLALLAAMYVNQYVTRARGYISYAVVIAIYLIYTTLTILLINRFFPFLTGRSRRG